MYAERLGIGRDAADQCGSARCSSDFEMLDVACGRPSVPSRGIAPEAGPERCASATRRARGPAEAVNRTDHGLAEVRSAPSGHPEGLRVAESHRTPPGRAERCLGSGRSFGSGGRAHLLREPGAPPAQARITGQGAAPGSEVPRSAIDPSVIARRVPGGRDNAHPGSPTRRDALRGAERTAAFGDPASAGAIRRNPSGVRGPPTRNDAHGSLGAARGADRSCMA